MTLSPGLNNPRFFSNSTRSKRFSTFRFVVMVLAPFKLRCCDIKVSQSEGADTTLALVKINLRVPKIGGRAAFWAPGHPLTNRGPPPASDLRSNKPELHF